MNESFSSEQQTVEQETVEMPIDNSAPYKLQRAARNGNVNSQVRLGKMYRYGREVSKDYEKAAYWFEKARSKGM